MNLPVPLTAKKNLFLIAGALLIIAVAGIVIVEDGLPGAFPGNGVAQGTPGNVITIDNTSSAIRNAVSSAQEGDTIILNPGIYRENDIRANHSITIRANTSFGGSPANTIIDGEGGPAGIFVSVWDNPEDYPAPSLIIDNLTLRNGHKAQTSGGGAVLGAGPVNITSSIISNCSTVNGDPNGFANMDGGFGGAINANGAVTIISSTITDCTAEVTGGAIFSSNGPVIINSSIINGCSAGSVGSGGSGGAISSGGSVTLVSSTISNCSAGFSGGAIDEIAVPATGSVTIQSSSVTNCSAGKKGGAVYSAGPVEILSSAIVHSTVMNDTFDDIADNPLSIISSNVSDCPAFNNSYFSALYSQNGITVNSSTISGCSGE
jgi:hypothetical protein